MSDLTRYEKELAQKLKKLSLPNEDTAWDDMSKLLDKDNDKGSLPPDRRNIILGSLIGALLIGLSLFVICNRKSTNNTQVNNETTNSKGTKDVQATETDKEQVNTNNKINNKEITNTKDQTITGNNITGSAKTIDGNDAKANQANDQTQSISDNTQLNSINQTTNNNEIKNNPVNHKEKATIIKVEHNTRETNEDYIKGNKANDQNIRNKNIPTRKASHRIIENKTREGISDNEVTANNKSLQNESNARANSYVTPTKKAVATIRTMNHNTFSSKKSVTKESLKNNNAVSHANVTANNSEIPVDQTSANNTIKTNTNSRPHHTKPLYYEQSTVAVSTKSSSRSFKNKNNTTAPSTKGKIHVSITNSNILENDTAIDTAQLIKIGQYVLANKKAKQHIIKKDTASAKPPVLIAKNSSTNANDNKKQLHISVGIGEQQAIRLSCDCVYPDDAYTTSSLVTDYIPSVYIKIQPAKKWFVQAEFKYKAPQYVQEQLYKENISNQPLNYIISTSVLKKVYYNQVPISFDYVIIPNLSVGVGMIYNSFAGQVSQNNVKKKLYGTAADSSISTSTETSTNGDSVLTFTKNSFQGLIEGQYEWNHFTFGARYAIGLQPYLKYNAPTSGTPTEKKNDALTVFIRFELWDSRSKKKSK